MKKKELFKKYSINKTHNVWESSPDNWMSIEIYRIMHDGNLPPQDDLSIIWVCDFLDKETDIKWWMENVMSQPRWGSLYLTAKRMIYHFADEILKELNKPK